MPPSEPPRVPRRRLIGAALTFYWISLFVATHLPEPDRFLSPEVSDKWLHFVSYGGLAFGLALWWSARHVVTAAGFIRLFSIVAAYGAVDEVSQGLRIVNRHADIYDWLVDLAGAVVGLMLFRVARGMFRRWWTAPDVR